MKLKVQELHVSQNGRFVIGGTNTHEVFIWDIKTKKLINRFHAIYTEIGDRLAVDNSGEYVATATYSEGRVTLYSLKDGMVIWNLYDIDEIQSIHFLPKEGILSIISEECTEYLVNVIGGDIFGDTNCQEILDMNEDSRIIVRENDDIVYKNISLNIQENYLAGVITPLGIAISQLGGGLSFWNENGNTWNKSNNKNEHIVKLSYVKKLDCIAGIIYKYNSPRKEPFFKLACYNIENGELMYENDLDNGIDFVFVGDGNEVLSTTGNIYSITEKQINLLMNIRKRSY